MWSRSSEPGFNAGEAGFTLVEALVALAIVAISLTAIGSLVGTSVHSAHAIDQRLVLVETTQLIMTGLSDRDRLAPGTTTGNTADHRWRLQVLPFSATSVDTGRAGPWVPQSVVVDVRSPGGRMLRIDTVRLRRPGESRP